MNSLRIVFMGTPEFAVASLAAIHETSQHQVVGVVTVPDKPAGRGQKVLESAVKKYASQKMQIPILQPEKLKDETFIDKLRRLDADVFVVIAFRMLPKAVWTIPPRGTINLHGSLLPQYRGAAPINRVVMNGEKSTGVTTFFINETIDTGALLLREEISIADDEEAGALHDRMKEIGAILLLKTLDAVAKDAVQPILQSEIEPNEPLKEAPKIFREDCVINWNDSAENIFNQIRGLSPYPAAFAYLENADKEQKTLKIFKTKIMPDNALRPGEIAVVGKRLFIGTNTATLELLEVQMEGKKRMSAQDFLNGFDITTFKMLSCCRDQ